MKKGLFVLAIASVMLGSCKSSKKGAWTDGDKKTVEKLCSEQMNVQKSSAAAKQLEVAGVKFDDFAKKACDCVLKKAEQNFESAKDADKDKSGLEKVASECGKEVVLEMMKK